MENRVVDLLMEIVPKTEGLEYFVWEGWDGPYRTDVWKIMRKRRVSLTFALYLVLSDQIQESDAAEYWYHNISTTRLASLDEQTNGSTCSLFIRLPFPPKRLKIAHIGFRIHRSKELLHLLPLLSVS
jgi:hypothetical protein